MRLGWQAIGFQRLVSPDNEARCVEWQQGVWVVLVHGLIVPLHASARRKRQLVVTRQPTEKELQDGRRLLAEHFLKHCLWEHLAPCNVVQPREEPVLDALQTLLNALELVCRIPVVQEQAIVQIKRVGVCLAGELQERLKALCVDRRRLQLHGAKHASDRVCDKLRRRRRLIVLLARHLHHVAALVGKDLEEGLHTLLAIRVIADADLFILIVEALPRAASTVHAKHRVGAQDVKVLRQLGRQQLLGKNLNGQYVHKQSAHLQPHQRHGLQHNLGGQDGRAEDDDVWVCLAEFVHVAVEGDAHRGCDLRVVYFLRPVPRDDVVAVAEDPRRQELTEAAEADQADCQRACGR
mmetsp:Transcript_42670/g.128091  ORF Transcript_42670/g.128091 Transcript_42670/m.128091 type:complete len:351 (+) Transcript_42670:611-1663(+)